MEDFPHQATLQLVSRLSEEHTTGLVRFQIVRELVKRNEPESVEALIAATKDSDLAVSYTAVEALGKMGDRQAVLPLIELVKHNMHTIEAVKALGSLGDTHATLPLIEILAKVNGTLYFEIIKALGNLKDTKAVETLTLLLKSPDLKVRWAAGEALARLETLRAENEEENI